MRLRVGELDQRIGIHREANIADDLGGQTVTLTPLADAWAKVVPRMGNERFFSDVVEATAEYMFIIRNREDIEIRENDRIVWRGVEYNISFISDWGGRSMYLSLYATRGGAQ